MAHAVRRPDNEYVVRELNTLINLDYDAIKAYEVAVERIQNDSYRTQLQAFKQDHAHHTQILAAIISKLGGEPAGQSDAHAVLAQGKVVIGNIVGDLAILKALHSNKRVINDVYEKARKNLADHPDIARALEENLRDEYMHKAWLEQTLKSIS